jgi:hypothetical protein
MRRTEEKKGITLIALVITVIILLILAGAAINITLNGGIIKKTEDAVTIYSQAARNEQEISQLYDEILDDKLNVVRADGSYSKKKGVNTPKLAKGMIPIKYDESKAKWVICSEDDATWYDYSSTERKWANVMLSDGTYKSGSTAIVGTEVEDSQLGSMFVWIPRYSYKITGGHHSYSTGVIEIKFLEGTSNKYAGEQGYASTTYPTVFWNDMLDYVLHPAFGTNLDLGGWDKDIPGIWVAKFKSTDGGVGVKVVPNQWPWASSPLDIGEMYTRSRQISTTNWEYYGFNAPDVVEAHLIKNSEWGAILYLSHSIYGRDGTEISLASGSYTGGGNYRVNLNQTTTGNIYGIYDINGPTDEYMAAYVANGSSSLGTYGGSFATNLVSTKYATVYRVGTNDTENDNYLANSDKYGDAVWETSGVYITDKRVWFLKRCNFPSTNAPFFQRSGNPYNYSGAFRFTATDGFSYGINTFRVTLI